MTSGVVLEACVATLAQARAAVAAGATRVELCGPGDGGTTPSMGLLEECLRVLQVPVHVMIRGHTEHFMVDAEWRAIMQRDITNAVRAGAQAVVIGPLTRTGEVDVETARAFVEVAEHLPVVFHRAFDQVPDQTRALDTLMALGISAVLTSGGQARALDGAEVLAELQARAGDRLTIMAGGGIRADNVDALLQAAPLRAVHARATEPSVFAETAAALRTSLAHRPHAAGITAVARGMRTALGLLLLASPFSQIAAQTSAPAQRPAAAYTPTRYAIIPRPVLLEPRPGEFTLTAATVITVSPRDSMLGHRLSRDLAPATGFALRVRVGAAPSATTRAISLVRDPTLDSLGAEGYALDISASQVRIRSAHAAGLFYGVQSLKQLLPPEILRSARTDNIAWKAPAVRIIDMPRFSWRGSHLDVSRHFMPVDYVKRHLDLMALHKLNTFHWHLTDDQGWRIQILKYPRLTEVGGCREQTLLGAYYTDPARQVFDGARHCGFYTQDDVKEVVAYAAARHITVVPEIEMPGHAQAAIAAYPELGVYPDSSYATHQVWGVSKVILNVEESTIAFLQDVLIEVMALFPGPFVHIGGDEADKTQWKASPRVQARMRELGVANEAALQSWFIRRMDSFLAERGRRLIGWDEILEGGLAPNAAVMSWRGTAGGIAAAKEGHDVVMTPTSHTYLDYYQSRDTKNEPRAFGGFLPLDTVYAYEPVPAALTREEAKHVLGAQAQLWSEYLKTPRHVEYMAFPRLSAFAEVVWTPASRKDYTDYHARLVEHMKRLTALGVNARPLDVPSGR